MPLGRDGCGIPVYCMPLQALALGMARFADPSGLAQDRAAAVRRLSDAMAAEPFYVNGTGGLTTEVMLAAADAVKTLRKGKGPAFIEAVTYRYRGHYLGDPENYRTKAEIAKWRKLVQALHRH